MFDLFGADKFEINTRKGNEVTGHVFSPPDNNIIGDLMDRK